MRRRYVLAPEAALDLVQIWRYIKSVTGADLTDEAVKFFPVYSYLIVYRPDTKPLHIVAILQGRRNVQEVLKDRL